MNFKAFKIELAISYAYILLAGFGCLVVYCLASEIIKVIATLPVTTILALTIITAISIIAPIIRSYLKWK